MDINELSQLQTEKQTLKSSLRLNTPTNLDLKRKLVKTPHFIE